MSWTWTDERVETLKRLWAEGKSANQIAEVLGEITRASVIGKIHRLGLSGRAKSPTAARRESASRTHKQAANLPPHTPALMELFDPPKLGTSTGRHCTLMDLTMHTCRWPIGEPNSPEFHFCGDHAPLKKPYCLRHSRVARSQVVSQRHTYEGQGSTQSNLKA